MSDAIARRIWGLMLWTIRRPLSRRLQAVSMRLVPPRYRETVRHRAIAQERFARRIGLTALRVTVQIALVSLSFTTLTFLILEGVSQGKIVLPTADNVRSGP